MRQFDDKLMKYFRKIVGAETKHAIVFQLFV